MSMGSLSFYLSPLISCSRFVALTRRETRCYTTARFFLGPRNGTARPNPCMVAALSTIKYL